MTYTFDDGQDQAVDTRLQNGILALLGPLVYQEGDPATARGPYLRTLDAIPQVPDMEYMTAQRTEYMRGMPGVLVYVGDGRRLDAVTRGRGAWYEREVLLVIFAGAAGNAVDGRLDVTSKVATDTRDDPGIRVIRQHVCELVEGQRPIQGASKALRVQGFAELETTADWTAWGITATVVVAETACATDTRAASVLDFIRTKHDVQNQGVIAQQKEPVT